MKKIFLVVMVVLGILIGSYQVWGPGYFPDQEKEAQASMIQKAAQDQKEHEYRDKLSQWVYDHSSKISRPMTRQIVDEVMKCPNPLLIMALIQAESEFSPTAYSSAQAVGLGQIRWVIWGKTLIEAGILKEARDLYDISVSIRATNHILANEIKVSKGDPIKALERYVGGKHKIYVDQVVYNFLHLSTIQKS